MELLKSILIGLVSFVLFEAIIALLALKMIKYFLNDAPKDKRGEYYDY